MKQKLVLLSGFLGLVGARAATIVVNGVSGSHIVTMENVDPAQMTVHDLRERVVSAKGGPAEGPFLQANLSLSLGTVNVGPEEYQGERGQEQDQPLGRRTRTVAEAFNLPRRRLSGKQAAGRLWRVPDRLFLTAVFHDVFQRVRDACAAATEPRENEMWGLVQRVERFHRSDNSPWIGSTQREFHRVASAVRALTSALRTVADVLGLQLADREHWSRERNGQRPDHEYEKNDRGEPVLSDRYIEVDWKQRAVAWRRRLVEVDNVVGQVDSLPLMPGAFRWKGHVPSKNFASLRFAVHVVTLRWAVESASVEEAPQWVQKALDACWVAAAEKSGIREVRPVHYAQIVDEFRDERGGAPTFLRYVHTSRGQWQFADGRDGRAIATFRRDL